MTNGSALIREPFPHNNHTTNIVLQEEEEENESILSFPTLLDAWLRVRGLEEAAVFSFLNLGLLAYVGGGEALSQVQVGDVPIFSYAGSVAFVLWRSVYLVKQVATRNNPISIYGPALKKVSSFPFPHLKISRKNYSN